VTLQYYIHYLPSADGRKDVDRLDTMTVVERENALTAEAGDRTDRTPAGLTRRRPMRPISYVF